MHSPDDKTLTRFLIACFEGIFEGDIKPLEKKGVPKQLSKQERAFLGVIDSKEEEIQLPEKQLAPKNLTKYKHSEGDLTYLETTAGDSFRYQTDVRVFSGPEDDRWQIWGMSVVVNVNQDEMIRCKVAPIDLRNFLYEARSRGFILTRHKMDNDQKFSIFEIPAHQREGPERPGSMFRYREGINDNLTFFGGDETIAFQPSSREASADLYVAYFQGGRLL